MVQIDGWMGERAAPSLSPLKRVQDAHGKAATAQTMTIGVLNPGASETTTKITSDCVIGATRSRRNVRDRDGRDGRDRNGRDGGTATAETAETITVPGIPAAAEMLATPEMLAKPRIRTRPRRTKRSWWWNTSVATPTPNWWRPRRAALTSRRPSWSWCRRAEAEVVDGLSATGLGGAQKVHPRPYQQGEHLQHSDYLHPESLFRENVVRGCGLLGRSIIQAQAVSPTFTNVYAALVVIINFWRVSSCSSGAGTSSRSASAPPSSSPISSTSK